MPEEFTCGDCGRTIVAIPYDTTYMHLCAACLMIPGWWKIPEIAKRIDPEHDRTVEDDLN
jgi:hypothetical protein